MNRKELLAQQLRELSIHLQSSHDYSPEQVMSSISSQDSIPATVFATELSPLQALVTHLKDNKKQSFSAIAQHLGRSYRAIWGSYHKEGIKIDDSTFYIPLKQFNTSSHSILELVVLHLKDHYEMKFSEIARLLNKDDRTIWTVWNRAQKKNGKNS